MVGVFPCNRDNFAKTLGPRKAESLWNSKNCSSAAEDRNNEVIEISFGVKLHSYLD